MHLIVTRVQALWNALLIAGMLASSSAASAGETDAPPGTTDMPTVVPNQQETAESVFAKLDNGQKGYISLADVTVLPGFDRVFQKSDVNHDGKLTLKEFKTAWPAYTGNSSGSEGATGTK